jgi:SAM-dependent methyltransferase
MTVGKAERAKFSGRYSGKAAEDYEAMRRGEKWDREEEVFDRLYERIAPKRVLDCPVGTGRFIERYVRDGVSAVGVDLSDDMLAQAAKKIPAGAGIELRKVDILSKNPAALGSNYDLVVCIRFLYAIGKEGQQVLLKNFAAIGARHLLVGVRMWPQSTGFGTRLLWHVWNKRKNKPKWPFGGHKGRYIAPEAEFNRLVRDCGWEIVEKALITEDEDAFGRYFYLLRNAAA